MASFSLYPVNAQVGCSRIDLETELGVVYGREHDPGQSHPV